MEYTRQAAIQCPGFILGPAKDEPEQTVLIRSVDLAHTPASLQFSCPCHIHYTERKTEFQQDPGAFFFRCSASELVYLYKG